MAFVENMLEQNSDKSAGSQTPICWRESVDDDGILQATNSYIHRSY